MTPGSRKHAVGASDRPSSSPMTHSDATRIAALWRAGRNTAEIAHELRLLEAAVADEVRREREARLGIGRAAS